MTTLEKTIDADTEALHAVAEHYEYRRRLQSVRRFIAI